MALNLIENLRKIALPIVERHGAYIVELIVRGERSSKVVELYVDTDSGISIDLCTSISREFSMQLDEEDVIAGRYRLDVSSPGVGRPLKLPRQYIRNVGRSIKIKITTESGTAIIEGKLMEAKDDSIVVSTAARNSEIPTRNIVEATIVPQIK